MISESGIAGRIVRHLAIELKVDEADVVLAGSLRADLQMDSVAAANILFALEEDLGVEIDLGEVVSLDTLADFVGVVAAAVGDA
jgi:acyl carrier protein